jgi:hypothetical protein
MAETYPNQSYAILRIDFFSKLDQPVNPRNVRKRVMFYANSLASLVIAEGKGWHTRPSQ